MCKPLAKQGQQARCIPLPQNKPLLEQAADGKLVDGWQKHAKELQAVQHTCCRWLVRLGALLPACVCRLWYGHRDFRRPQLRLWPRMLPCAANIKQSAHSQDLPSDGPRKHVQGCTS